MKPRVVTVLSVSVNHLNPLLLASRFKWRVFWRRILAVAFSRAGCRAVFVSLAPWGAALGASGPGCQNLRGPALVCISGAVGTWVGGRALERAPLGLRDPLARQGVLLASWVKSFAELMLGFLIILSKSKVSGEMRSLGSKDRPC